MAAIDVNGVTMSYGDFRALDGVSLHVERGEFFGLIGPNGAGKTTLVKLLIGQICPDEGTLRVLGKGDGQGLAIKEMVGIVPEAETPPTFLTSREFLQLVCRIRGLGQIDTKVERWLSFFELNEKENVLSRDLSKGQRQKLMLASAFIHSPELLFLDEPFINLDPIFQRKVRQYLLSESERGTTIFMCTHILEIAQKLCTRVAVINRGRIMAKGSIDELRSKGGEDLENIFMRLVEGDVDT